MALSNDQIYLLNMLYTGKLQDGTSAGIHTVPTTTPSGEPRSVGEIARDIRATLQAEVDRTGGYQDSCDGSSAQYLEVYDKILSDPTLSNMKVVDMYADSGLPGSGEGSAHCFTVVTGDGTSPKEAVTVFQGSASRDDWRDNFLGGNETTGADGVSTQLQQDYMNHYQQVKEILAAEGVEYTSVTGHSKGGNKAQYITLMDGSVDRCVSFDGQGFSDQFLAKYRDEIAMRQDKITNYAAENDYVNILLNQIGEKIYIEGNGTGENFLANHSMYNMWQGGEDILNGNHTVSDRITFVRDLDQFVNGYLRDASPEDRAGILDTLGNLLAETHPNGQSAWANILSQLIVQGKSEYALKFLGAFLGFASTLSGKEKIAWLEQLGVGDMVMKLIDSIGDMSLLDIAKLLGALLLAGGALAISLPVLIGYLLPMIPGFLEAFGKGRAVGKDRESGKDIAIQSEYSPYDRIKVDTEGLEQICAKLGSVTSALNGIAAEIRGCAADCDAQMLKPNLSLSLPLLSNIAGIVRAAAALIGSPSRVLKQMARSTEQTAEGLSSYTKTLRAVCADFDTIEKRNAGLAASTDHGKSATA